MLSLHILCVLCSVSNVMYEFVPFMTLSNVSSLCYANPVLLHGPSGQRYGALGTDGSRSNTGVGQRQPRRSLHRLESATHKQTCRLTADSAACVREHGYTRAWQDLCRWSFCSSSNLSRRKGLPPDSSDLEPQCPPPSLITKAPECTYGRWCRINTLPDINGLCLCPRVEEKDDVHDHFRVCTETTLHNSSLVRIEHSSLMSHGPQVVGAGRRIGRPVLAVGRVLLRTGSPISAFVGQ